VRSGFSRLSKWDNVSELGSAHRGHLAEILRQTAAELTLKFERARTAVGHSGVAGQEGERIVAGFLRERLPEAIGVTTGEVVDSQGGRSRQIDVILYDAMRTPMIFSGEQSETHVVPAEGVLAVVEVKTHLRSGDIGACLTNCRSVKQRVRTAYFRQPIEIRYAAYGQEWVDMPIHYSVFAATSDNLYSGRLNDLQADVPIEERIDLLCCLDRGVAVNAGIDLSGGISAIKTVFSGRSLPSGGLANIEDPSKSLLIWYSMLATAVMQAMPRPIDISRYLSADLRVEAKMPGGAISRGMHDAAVNAMAEDQGVDAGLLRRWQAKEPLDLRDLYDLMRAPGFSLSANVSVHQRALIEAAMTSARTLTFEEWEALGIVET
jgi:uncharacterized protein DUF6602